MKGFIGGSLALIVLWTLVQKQSAAQVASGASLLVQIGQRALSPKVAGIPDRAHATTKAPATPAGGAGLLGPLDQLIAASNAAAKAQGNSTSGTSKPGPGQYHTQN